jgi:RNA polymerase sigma-70 factor, ECF subfamily
VKNNSSDEKDFRVFYDEHYTNLCRAAYRILRDKDASREVTQEVFIEVWNRKNWREFDSAKAYLYVAVYNRSIKFIGKGKRLVSDEFMPNTKEEQISPVEQNELEQIVAEGINNLPEKCKEIFILSREEEMTYQQIATHLGLSIKTVENQMGIALKKLRDHLGAHW